MPYTVTRTLLVLLIVAVTVGLSLGQQPILKTQAQFSLAGELVALAACNSGTQLVAASKTGGGATTLYVFNTVTRQVVGTPVGIPIADPSALVLNADCTTAFLADATGNKVLTISLPSGAVRAEIAVGKRPIALARATHNNDLYSVNTGDGTLNVIDTATSAIKASVTVGTSPESIALYSAGAFNRAFVTHGGLNAITVTDINDNSANLNRYQVVQTARTGPAPGAITAAAGTLLGDLYVYFVNTGNDTLSRIGTTTFQIDSTFSIGDAPRAVFLDPVFPCVYTVNTGSRAGVGFVKATFVASPGAQPGQDPFHNVQLLNTAERLSRTALLVPVTVAVSSTQSKIERQLWVVDAANTSQLLFYLLDGFCTQ